MQARQCVILQGEATWCSQSSQSLLADIANQSILWISDSAPPEANRCSQRQTQQQLGKEFTAVIFDGLDQLNPDSLAAVIGTITAGGLLLIWLPAKIDPSLWLQRLSAIAADFHQHAKSFHWIKQGESLPQLAITQTALTPKQHYQSTDQQQAVAAILKVAQGHRRRPLVLSADRGRGKSAALGIAAAQLIQQGTQTIIVTAPSLATTDIIFSHAADLLTQLAMEPTITPGSICYQQASIRFIAPDKLISSKLTANLLLIDEAAAIATPILQQLLANYARLVFATTLYGYEGTGRGFAIRFQKILDQQTPDWRHIQLTPPIRWVADDPLEQFSFQALLLNASPVADSLISAANSENCQIAPISSTTLITDETALNQLFSLLVLAHYRTRPSDVKMILDRPDMTLYIARYQGHIVACAYLIQEGELDSSLCQAVYNGTRRLQGHLLPQSLLAHCAVEHAGELRYQRIARIVVHPAIQQRQLGQKLLQHCIQQAGCDIIGTSFAMTSDLVQFWTKSAFQLARLGSHKDEVSGTHSVMMLHALSSAGQAVVTEAKQRLQQQWPLLLLKQFQQLPTAEVLTISQLLAAQPTTRVDKAELTAFAFKQRSYPSCQITLWQWFSQQVAQLKFQKLNSQQQSLVIKLVLQQQPWDQLGYTGKAQAVNTLRAATRILLTD